MVVCLERGADLHMVQLIPLPLIVSCFSKIQIGFTFLVPAHPGSPGKRAVKRVCVCLVLHLHIVLLASNDETRRVHIGVLGAKPTTHYCLAVIYISRPYAATASLLVKVSC